MKSIVLIATASLAVAQTTIIRTATATLPQQTVFVTSTEPVPSIIESTSTLTDQFRGKKQYVTLFDHDGDDDESMRETFAALIIGSSGPTTSYEIVPTIQIGYSDGTTIKFDTTTVTAAPTSYATLLNNPDVTTDESGEKIFKTFSVWCSVGGTTTAACTSTFIGGPLETNSAYFAAYPRTTTSTSLVFQTYEVVELVTVTPASTAQSQATASLTSSRTGTTTPSGTVSGTRSSAASPTQSKSAAGGQKEASMAIVLGVGIVLLGTIQLF